MKKKTAYSIFLLGVGMTLAIGLFTVSKHWDQKVIFACMVYALIVSVFLGAQLVGFVMSHVKYSEEIEYAKYKMLLEEEKEWQ